MEEKQKEEEVKNENENENNAEENFKIISNYEYKSSIVEEPDLNIVLSENKNNINFMSFELLISLLKDDNLGKTNKNINYNDILIYIVYQKNVIMTSEIFFQIIESLLKGGNIETGLILLNTYLVNYYSTEILPSFETIEKVINLYKLSNKEIIVFKIPFDEDKKIELEKLIEYII